MTKNKLNFFEDKFTENLDSICIFRKAQSRVSRKTEAHKNLEKQIMNFYSDLDAFLLMIPHKTIESFYKNYLVILAKKPNKEIDIACLEELRCFEIALNILKLNKLGKIRAKKQQYQQKQKL